MGPAARIKDGFEHGSKLQKDERSQNNKQTYNFNKTKRRSCHQERIFLFVAWIRERSRPQIQAAG